MAGAMLTKDLVFGLNLVSLAGFAVMAIGLNLGRAARSRAPLGFVLMGVGTALVFFGLYLGGGLK
jgi:FtsH-binding integral membrane protein